MAEKKKEVKPKKKKEFELDIFKLLGQINSKDMHIWETLTEEERKKVSFYVIPQWLYGTDNQFQIILNNELVNPYVFKFPSQHPELLMKLMACVGDGSRRRFKWKPLPRSQKDTKLRIKVIMEYYDYSEREAISTNHLLSSEDVILYAEELGWSKEDILKLKKEN